MKKADIQALLEPMIAVRMMAHDPHTDVGNGTPLAAAAATALAIDMANGGARAAREAQKRVDELTTEQLTTTMTLVASAIGQRRLQWKGILPFGTPIESSYYPGAIIGPKNLELRRGHPGFHNRMQRRNAIIDVDGTGCNMLRRAIIAAMQPTTSDPEYDLPAPCANDIKIEAHGVYRYKLLIPMRGGPATSYMNEEIIESPEHMLDKDIASQATATAERAADIFKARDQIDKAYADIMAEMEPFLDEARLQGLPFRLAGVKIHNSSYNRQVTPMFETLGSDLKPTTWECHTGYGVPMSTTMGNHLAGLRRLKKRADRTTTGIGAGEIDIVTLAMLRSRDIDITTTMERLAKSKRITVQLGRNPGRHDTMGMSWRQGIIGSSFDINEKIAWNYGTLILKKIQLPESIVTVLPGRALSTVLEHDGLPDGLVIRSITGENGSWLKINVNVPTESFGIAR